ncbi:Heterokaryon incompatibility [Macrophomina phaseolina MS6]|uniref:Heterokaryon incompatibility n=1 Tax=Macrophomina phaseolina (strain MS6) TaxID=1126212 RepID=K2SY49_MACPH|nr:Heterokaryon incompatibility [Macrophomina phaseolina MS6]
MLCDICTGVLCHHAGRRKSILHDLRFDHHQRKQSLLLSLEQGCSICSVLARQLEGNGVDLGDGGDLRLQASLSLTWGRQLKRRYYSLEFILEGEVIRTFALQPKVFKLADRWISECQCASPKQEWYPDRLLDLSEVKSVAHLGQHDISKAKVYLLRNSEDWKAKESAKPRENRYVTLSHRWGKAVPVTLVAHNMAELMTRGIALEDLPKTFQDTIIFASQLKEVRYLWIDSLCIVQKSKGDDGLHEEDWYTQSAVMDKVYHKSYLNISATTSPDSSVGLFQKRNLDALKEEKVNLNISGLVNSKSLKEKSESKSLKGCVKAITGSLFKCLKMTSRTSHTRRCTIVDVSLWDDMVEQAPVNTRGWVYQERLLAPRILHFCDGQITWECSERNCTERYPDGIPFLQLKSGDLVERNLLKSFEPENEGKILREARLNGNEDPDKDLPRLHTYELWRRIVEVYSQKDLTVPGDKLIGLSGIAKYFFEFRLKADPKLPQWDLPYVAGLWSEYLESQLLWRVEPVFKDDFSQNVSKRHELRAPSFSWAALDSPQGIIYGEFTNQDLFFRVKSVEMRYIDGGNEFGLVEGLDCHLLLEARLIQVDLQRLDQEVAGVPYGWRFTSEEESDDPYYDGVHGNIYLDSPDSDDDVFEPGARIFCMPAARGERTAKPSERYLICLLLQLKGSDQEGRCFKRIGLTKLSSYEEEKSRKALENTKTEQIYLF